MNEKEKYFTISLNGSTHILSDRIHLNWKEIFLVPISISIPLVFLLGWLVGIWIGLLSGILYTLYRFAAWFYYTEIQYDSSTNKLTRIKMLLQNPKSTELITNKVAIERFEYLKMSRSGKTKYILNYKTHKDNPLMILRNEKDKSTIEKYINNNWLQQRL